MSNRKKKRKSHGFDWRARYVDDERLERVVEVKVQTNRLTAHAYGLDIPEEKPFDLDEVFGKKQWIEVGRVWRGSKPSRKHPSWSFEVDGRFFGNGRPLRGTQEKLAAAVDAVVVAAKPVLLRLRCVPDQEYAIPRLLAQLRDKNPSTIFCVAQSMAQGRHTLILALIDALKDDPTGGNARVLRELREHARFAVPGLVSEIANGRSPSSRCHAAHALRILGREAEDAVPALIAALEGGDTLAHCAMSATLASIAAETVDVVPTLIHSLDHDSSDIQRGVSFALGHLGNSTDEVVPALLAAARGRNPTLRAHANSGLGYVKLASADVVLTLIEGLRDENRDVRSAAASSLGKIGRDAMIAVPALVAAVRDADGVFLREAIDALGRFGDKANGAVNLLIEALNDKEVDYAAAETLKRVGKGAKDAESALIKALDHENPLVRYCIADLLRSLDANVPGLDDICELSLIDL